MKLFIFLIALVFSIENISAMAWGIENESHEKFNILFERGDLVDIIMSCDKKSWQSLDREFRKFFKKVGNEFRYSRSGRDYSEPDGWSEEFSYFPKDQKLVCNGTPQIMSIADLAKIIGTQKVIFYTGAGISAGAVPTMDELEKSLGFSQNLQEERNLQRYVGGILRNPDCYAEILQEFFNKCDDTEPTVAHVALEKMVTVFHHMLVTENLDKLHRKTGLDPIVFAGREQYSEALKNDVKNVNFVVTVGLHTDESGFLKWYKSCNPNGKIISINLVDTCYLSDDDFSIKGNAQEIIPQIGDLL
jgi:NAD-dependent deacetylase